MAMTPEERERQKEIAKIQIEESLNAYKNKEIRKDILKTSLSSYASILKIGCLIPVGLFLMLMIVVWIL